MTCIVGIERAGKVYLGADRAGCNSWTCVDAGVSKVFENGPIIAGYSGSFRFGQLLEHAFEVPKQPPDMEVMRYLCVDFIDALRKTMKAKGLAEVENNVEEIRGSALIGYRGALYELDADLQIRPQRIASVGSGYIAALGVLHHLVSVSPRMKPERVLEHALVAAAAITGTVSGPFNFVSMVKRK